MNRMRDVTTVLLSVILLGTPPLVRSAVEPGVVLKADSIRAEPFNDAKTLALVSKGAAVDILEKKGGWLQVRTNGKQGWIRMLSVKRGTASGPDAAKEIGGLAGVATGRAGTGQVVSTTGVRGLGEADLKAAKFDEAQVKKAESFAVSVDAAAQFAASAKLQRVSLDFLPEPKPEARPEASGGRR